MNTSKVIEKKVRGGADSAPPPVWIGLSLVLGLSFKKSIASSMTLVVSYEGFMFQTLMSKIVPRDKDDVTATCVLNVVLRKWSITLKYWKCLEEGDCVNKNLWSQINLFVYIYVLI